MKTQENFRKLIDPKYLIETPMRKSILRLAKASIFETLLARNSPDLRKQCPVCGGSEFNGNIVEACYFATFDYIEPRPAVHPSVKQSATFSSVQAVWAHRACYESCPVIMERTGSKPGRPEPVEGGLIAT